MDIHFEQQPKFIVFSVLFLLLGLIFIIEDIYFSGIIFVGIGIVLTRMTQFVYVIIDKYEMIIRARKFIPWNKKIQYEDIDYIEVLGKHIIVYLKNGRTFKLENDYIANDKLAKMREKLTEIGVEMK